MRTAREVLEKLAAEVDAAATPELAQDQPVPEEMDPEQLSRMQKMLMGMGAGAAPWAVSDMLASAMLTSSREGRHFDALFRGGAPTIRGGLGRLSRGAGHAAGLGALLGGGIGLLGAEPETAGGVAGVFPGALTGLGAGALIGGAPGALIGAGLGGYGGYQGGKGVARLIRGQSE